MEHALTVLRSAQFDYTGEEERLSKELAYHQSNGNGNTPTAGYVARSITMYRERMESVNRAIALLENGSH